MKKKYCKIIAIILTCIFVFNACGSSENAEENSTGRRRAANSSEETGDKTTGEPGEEGQVGTAAPTEPVVTPDITSELEPSVTTYPTLTEMLTSTPEPTLEPAEEDEDALYNSSPVIEVQDMEYTYYGQTGLYTGEWKGDRPQGYGCLYIDDDNFYDGEWDYGYINGNAEIAYIDEEGAWRHYIGDCACKSIVGSGEFWYYPDEEVNDYIVIRGDFSAEPTLVYFSVENGEMVVDMGSISEGRLWSEVDYICDNPGSPFFTYDTEVIIYNDMYNGIGARSYVGNYYGDKNTDLNPQGYGIFQLVGEILPDKKIYLGDRYVETDYLHSKIVIGWWENGRLTGNYVLYDVVKPLDESYFDYGHECKKDYYYRIDGVLDKRVSYVDKTWYYDNDSAADDFYIATCHYADYTQGEDGIYRAGLDESDVYYYQDYLDGKTLLPAGTYCREETYPCYVIENGDQKYFKEGFRAYYDSDGKMFRYIEYDKKHPYGNVVVGDEWNKIKNAIIIAGTIFFGAFVTYKIIASTASGNVTAKATEKGQKKEYDFSEEKRYMEQKQEAEDLRAQARALEDQLKYGTLWEYEVNDLKKQIQYLYDEAARKEPSIFN